MRQQITDTLILSAGIGAAGAFWYVVARLIYDAIRARLAFGPRKGRAERIARSFDLGSAEG